jgi:hypothetical protein
MKAAVVFCAVMAGAVGQNVECPTCKVKEGLGDVLLQNMESLTKTVMNDEGGANNFIQIDGSSKTPSPRRTVGTFTREILVHFPLDKNPITLAEKGAIIKLGELFQGKYVRFSRAEAAADDPNGLTDPLQQEDFGVVSSIAFPSNGRKQGKLMLAEKSHAFYLPEGAHRTTTEKRMPEFEAQEQNANLARLARASAATRATMVTMTGLAIMPQLISTSFDPHAVGTAHHAARANDRTPEAELEESFANAHHKMAELEAKRSDEIVRSSFGCVHFEDMEGVVFTDETVTVPLEQKLVVFRGRLVSFPNEEYQYSSGVSFFRVSADKKTLELYMGFVTTSEFVDSPTGFSAQLTVGPGNGGSMPIPPDSRGATQAFDPATSGQLGFAWNYANTIPRDFGFLKLTREQAGCKSVHSIPLGVYNFATNIAAGNLPVAVGEMQTLFPCFISYFRPSANTVSAYDWPEALGIIHMIVETPPSYLVAAAGADWDEIKVPMDEALIQSKGKGQTVVKMQSLGERVVALAHSMNA